MYHQLSKVTGRLVAASHLQTPLFPIVSNLHKTKKIPHPRLNSSATFRNSYLLQTPIALQRVEAAAIKYTTAHLSSVAEGAACAAGKQKLVPGTNIPFPPVPENIRKNQALFQV